MRQCRNALQQWQRKKKKGISADNIREQCNQMAKLQGKEKHNDSPEVARLQQQC